MLNSFVSLTRLLKCIPVSEEGKSLNNVFRFGTGLLESQAESRHMKNRDKLNRLGEKYIIQKLATLCHNF